MPRTAEGGACGARPPELEATGVHIGRGVAARAVAIESADRHVSALGPADDRDRVAGWWSGERPRARAVTGEAPADALVRAGDGIQRIVARGGVALRAHGGSWDVIGRLRGCGQQIRCESGCRHVAGAAVATGRVLRVECGRTGVSGRSRGAREHPDVGRALVTGRARAHRRYGGVAGDRERRACDARRAEFEAARIHIRCGVAARAVAIEVAERNVIARAADNLDVGEGPGDRRTVTGETPAHALVR